MLLPSCGCLPACCPPPLNTQNALCLHAALLPAFACTLPACLPLSAPPGPCPWPPALPPSPTYPSLQGRYVSITAQSRVSLCVVEVYPLVANAALGKPTTASSGGADSGQAAQVVNGNLANTVCATVVSGSDLAAWITIDLGYQASVETVVVQNGFSRFDNDLFIRRGAALLQLAGCCMLACLLELMLRVRCCTHAC